MTSRDFETGHHPGTPTIEEIDYLNACMVFDYDIIGKYYIGSHRMIFGTRIRAGELFEPFCNIDICCGEQDVWLQIVKRLYMLKMRSNIKKNVHVFDGLYPNTKFKPVHTDINFVQWLGELSQAMGNEFKFTISYDENENAKYIRCNRCGMASYSEGDIKHLYCGKCKVFHITGKCREHLTFVKPSCELDGEHD